jgi:hypothetical protein
MTFVEGVRLFLSQIATIINSWRQKSEGYENHTS